MSRSGAVRKRIIAPEDRYQSDVLARFINRVMFCGKKTAAEEQVYKAMDLIKQKTGQDPLMVFTTAVENVKPSLEVRSRRVGGAAYQVPMPVRSDRKESLAVRWLIQAANKRSNSEFHTFAEKLSAEIVDAFNNLGGAMKKKEDTRKMADANKAFAHFRW